MDESSTTGQYRLDDWHNDRAVTEIEPLGIVSVLRRQPAIPVVCFLVSMALGILYYQKTPPTFESSVDILFETKQSPLLGVDSLAEYPTNQSVANHVYSLTSPIIVERALQNVRALGSLNESENPVALVTNSLSVQVVSKESDIVSLKCRSKSKKDCYKILCAITKCYEEFLGERNEDLGAETTSLIMQAKDELLVQLQDREKRYHEFRQNAPLIWQNGKGVNRHHERQLQIEASRSSVAIERARHKSKLDGVTEKLKTEEGRKLVLFQALNEMTELSFGDKKNAELLTRRLDELMSREAELSDSYGEGHPELVDVRRRMKEITDGELATATAFIDNAQQVNEYAIFYVTMLKEKLEDFDREIAELNAAFNEEQGRANALQAFVSQNETLRQDVMRTQQLFDAVVARLEEIDLVGNHGGERMRVMAAPQLGAKIAPTLAKNLSLAGTMGLLVGCGLAFLFDSSEATFRTPQELRQSLRLPIIGMVPQMQRKKLRVRDELPSLASVLVTAHQTESNAAEAFRAVRTSLFFSTQGERPQVVQVTSPMPSDGKSTIAANLAITVAQTGKRVLLVDADFRRPSQHVLFGRPKYSEYGLAEVVLGKVDPNDEDMKTEIENLFVLTCGKRPDNPSELLSMPDLDRVLVTLRSRYDFIVVDTPPILAVTDPISIAARVDGVLLALRIRRGSKVAATRATLALVEVDAKILGVVVNAVDKTGMFGGSKYGYGGGYGYGYRYASEEYREDVVVEKQKQLSLQS